jgi:RNA polymerase sigma factor (sigma-70 family)
MVETNGSDLNLLLSNLLVNKNSFRKFENFADQLLHHRTKFLFARQVDYSDIVSSVVLKLLTGEINWDSGKSSLDAFFFSRIRTEITNLVKKEKKFIPASVNKSEIVNDYSGESEEDVSEFPRCIICPFEDNENNEEQAFSEEFKTSAFELFKDSDEEFLVLDGIYNGLHTREIALDLGITKDDVHNIKRRINRVLKAKFNPPKHKFINEDKPLDNSLLENKPGKSTPDNNNIGELI